MVNILILYYYQFEYASYLLCTILMAIWMDIIDMNCCSDSTDVIALDYIIWYMIFNNKIVVSWYQIVPSSMEGAE